MFIEKEMGSATTFDSKILRQLLELNPTSILDIGAGGGKYGKLLKSALPNCRIDAVEPTQKYVDENGLTSIYDTVYQMNIEEYLEKHPRGGYDVVIIGDILEHLYRSRVIDYLDFLVYNNNWILCIWPTNLRQHDTDGNSYECHRSNFKLKDLSDKFEVVHYEKKFQFWCADYVHPSIDMHYCVLKGIPNRIDTNYTN